jgi:FkbM family methyltransferase
LVEHLEYRFSNVPTDRLTIDGRALSDKNEKKIFMISNADTISTFSQEWISESRFSKTFKWDIGIEVQTTTLDNIIQEYGVPDFVKIDVEGYELEVLSGLTKLLEKTIFSFEWAEEQYKNIQKIQNRLNSIGYKNYSFTYSDSYIEVQNIVWSDWDSLRLHDDIDSNRKNLWGMIYFKK